MVCDCHGKTKRLPHCSGDGEDRTEDDLVRGQEFGCEGGGDCKYPIREGYGGGNYESD